MAEGAQNRVQTAIKKFVNDIDKQHLRGLERVMHECAAKCCSNTTDSIEDVHACVEKCQEPTLKAQRFVQSELERFQESMSRCVLQCQEDIKDQVTPTSTDAEIARFKTDFETCAINCCDKNIEKLPHLYKRVQESLKLRKN